MYTMEGGSGVLLLLITGRCGKSRKGLEVGDGKNVELTLEAFEYPSFRRLVSLFSMKFFTLVCLHPGT